MMSIEEKNKLIRRTVYLKPTNKLKLKRATAKYFEETTRHCSSAGFINNFVEHYLDTILKDIFKKGAEIISREYFFKKLMGGVLL